VIPVPQVLRVRAFRRVWLATLASNAGSWLQMIAGGWLILQLTGSPAAVGALALVLRGPALVLSPYAGGLADRLDRRILGAATFLAQALAAAALAAVTFAGVVSPLLIYLLTFALGVGFALGLPAMLALVPSLVAPQRLPQAVSLNAAGINVARLVGPAVGGVTLAVFGAGVCFVVNALSFLALVAALLTLPAGTRRRPAGHRRGVRPAMAFARRDPASRRLLVGMAVFCALAAPVQELAPVVARRLGDGPGALGALLGAMGGGALAGVWALERLTGSGYPRHLALPTATLGFAAGALAVAASPWLPLSVLAMAAAGFFWIWMFAGTNTAIQLGSPPALLGRMLGLYQLSVIGPIALGALAAGALAEVVGIRLSLGACALGLVVWGAWSLTHRVPAIDGPAPGDVLRAGEARGVEPTRPAAPPRSGTAPERSP
jgi:predicted MFS family arabinose efflux permease